jgi:NADH-quinone oxidoreductase subunit L
MVTSDSRLVLLVLFPLLGAVIAYLIGRVVPRLAGVVASIAVALSAGLSFSLWQGLSSGAGSEVRATLSSWISFQEVALPLELLFDPLSAVMCLLVTGVGCLIHLYAIGYMAADASQPRFFAYLNLFIFSMLLLVLGRSMPVVFIGWEGVGLCSYLLIGFWFTNGEYASAGRKAFVMNRIGDLGFLVAMAVLYSTVGTLDLVELRRPEVLERIPADLGTLVAVALFFAATGKSAQIPLFTWLPDAMAGPTPVSALIHAATMVTAGVYLMARCAGLLELNPAVPALIVWVAIATAILAGTTALAQNDIKKVLAYSTVSQLGLMFVAVGVGAYSVALFHVVTHAFFKACLFLSAGSVIHGCHHEQDLRRMGGLWRAMPLTCLAYGVATLAIAGVWPCAGFFSKHAIFDALAVTQNPVLRSSVGVLTVLATLVAVCTAVYMTRSCVLAFGGRYRGEGHPHEAPVVMTGPVLVLAVLSLLGGLYLEPHFFHYLAGVVPDGGISARGHGVLDLAGTVKASLPGLIGIAVGVVLFAVLPNLKDQLRRLVWPFEWLFAGKYFVDQVYDTAVVAPITTVSRVAFRSVDAALVEGSGRGVAVVSRAVAELTRRMTTGQVGTYLLAMLVAVGVVCSVFITAQH